MFINMIRRNLMFQWLLVLLVACYVPVFADEVRLVVNDHVFTKEEIQQEAERFVKLTKMPEESLHDQQFLDSVREMITKKVLVQDFADHNKLSLTTEEEAAVLEHFMNNSGEEEQDFDLYVSSLDLPPAWVREFLVGQALMNKVASVVVGPQVKIDTNEIEQLQQELLDSGSEYLLKSWLLSHDHQEANMNAVKVVKQQWAQTGENPQIGEVMDLGWRKKSELPGLFVSAIDGVEAGNIVGPMVSEHGYHLVWYENNKVPQLPSNDQLTQVVFQQKFHDSYLDWLEQLSDKSAVIQKV